MLQYAGNYYGHYQVGSNNYLSKVRAILDSEQSHKEIKFVLYDDTYTKLNWQQEPTQSLQDLYAQRAWELRNRYDYLVLHFSGGSDSLNILETFIRNNIRIEELFIRGPLKKVDKNIHNNKAENNYAEVFFQSLPIAEYVKKYFYPDLKITVCDTSDYTWNFFTKNKEWFNIDTTNLNYFSPGIAWRADYDIVNTDFRKITESGKTVSHIVGVDKPMMYFKDKKFFIRFLDKTINIHMPFRNTQEQNPIFIEPFYWSQTTGPMIIKQGHKIKNYLNQNKIDPECLNNVKGRSFHDFISKIIYDRTLPIHFNPEKVTGGLVHPWDMIFLENQNTDFYKHWTTGMDYFEKIIPDKWKHNGSVYNDMVGIWSRSYCLGE